MAPDPRPSAVTAVPLPTDPDALLLRREVADLLGVGEDYVETLRAQYGLPYVPLGGGRKVRFRRGDVIDWAAKRRRVTEAA